MIGLKFGDILEHAEAYSTLFLSLLGQISMERNPSRIFSIWEGFGTLSPYLEMSERAERTQGVGQYCRRGPQWILSNWNSEILPIIGVAAWISIISRLSLE